MIPPQLPPRPAATGQYHEWQPVPRHYPLVPTARLQLPRPCISTNVLLHEDHLWFVDLNRLYRMDICSGESEPVMERAEALALPNLYLYRGQWHTVPGMPEPVYTLVQWSEGTVHVNNVSHQLSRTRSISTATQLKDTLFVAFTDKTLSVYNTSGDRLQLLFWSLQADQIMAMSPSVDDRLAVWFADGQVHILDSALIDFNSYIKSMRPINVESLSVHAVTWNVGGEGPPSSASFWSAFLGTNVPNVILIGLQEVVSMDNTLRGNQEQVHSWRVAIERHLAGIGGYKVYNSVDMVGMVLFIILDHGTSKLIDHSSTTTIKCGLKGRHGNKGAVGWRAFLGDTSLCVVNCHLAAGQENVWDRNADAALIMKTMRFTPLVIDGIQMVNQFTDILDHELVVWMGDLNYRINLDRETVVSKCRENLFGDLLAHDQLHSSQSVLHHFLTEPKIAFPPTYKYDPMTDCFDTSAKQRTPSYCDRILFKPGTVADTVVYDSIRVCMVASDHKPVFADFNLHITPRGTRNRCNLL